MPRPLPQLAAQPPRPHRQRLQTPHDRLDVAPKRKHAHENAEHVDDVVAVGGDGAGATAVAAAQFVRFGDAGKGAGDGWALEEIGRRFGGGRRAGGDCEYVDEFEDEEFGECAAEVGYAVFSLVVIQLFSVTELGFARLTLLGASCMSRHTRDPQSSHETPIRPQT
jgi:hypothetical protein